MSKPLTAVAIEKLNPKTRRYEVSDGGQRGLLLAVFPTGARSFVVRYRYAGRKRKLTLGHIPLSAARKLAAEALYEVAQGRDPALAKQAAKVGAVEAAAAAKATAAEAQAHTVEAVCRSWVKREGGKLRTINRIEVEFERLIYPAIGNVPIGDLKRSRIVALLDDVQDRCGDRMADLTYAYLRRVLNWHASRVDDFASPVVRGMGRYDARSRAGMRTLSDDELHCLWAATEAKEGRHRNRFMRSCGFCC
jgi:Arm DNA-binding domain